MFRKIITVLTDRDGAWERAAFGLGICVGTCFCAVLNALVLIFFGDFS